jgi:DNA-binding CsgD family transcriptional regulator
MNSFDPKTGVMVVDSSLNIMATNGEAIQILSFPKNLQNIPNVKSWLGSKVKSRLIDRLASEPFTFVKQFRSAQRTYLCQALPLNLALVGNRANNQGFIVLMGRKANGQLRINTLYKRYGLTPREQQAVDALLQGMTSKEIAARMKISPNTVKAFLRLVMVKMKVTTRSGIVGKLVGPHAGS